MRNFNFLVLFFLGVFLFHMNFVGAEEFSEKELSVPKKVLILKSTKSYEEALVTAKLVSEKLSTKLDLRGLSPNKELGLSFSENDCKNDGWDFPCYVSRGRYDDGIFVSVEFSSAFTGFTKGYYIVVMQTSEKDNLQINETLNRVKKIIPDAYIKTTPIYMGCMH